MGVACNDQLAHVVARAVLLEIANGNPGALRVLAELVWSFPQEWIRIIDFLLDHGPRGKDLWIRYRDDCDSDSTMLGRDLLSRATEWGY